MRIIYYKVYVEILCACPGFLLAVRKAPAQCKNSIIVIMVYKLVNNSACQEKFINDNYFSHHLSYNLGRSDRRN
jgi:hypothetical protein